ncbi:hypothetical protein ROLI_038490 [Roseobacter fucihabitans]|uniref:Uncharacterized protein n=1 Tax=Roseobacter fucihabitans TaxID=1537242 RepID=A0ABZ2BXK7_9RHOB|nr:hypothetical protein [Roseobacter litoralis]MBC6967329.1 hypothetical protein [Roseobacter litoralis]
MQQLLWMISDNARACLIAGLVAGLALPGLAASMQPWLPQMVAGLLVITALRIGWRAARGAVSDLRWGVGSVAVLQLLLPVALFGLCWLGGVAQTPMAMAMVLATAAPAISGSPNLALLLGQDAGRMMQILVLGTAAFPITVMPILWLMPQLGTLTAIFGAALMLLAVITASTLVGFTLRGVFFPKPSASQIKALDGLSVLAFSAIVIGLMAALNPALRSDPGSVLLWGLLAFAISYGAQGLTVLVLRRSRLTHVAGPLAIGAGNRNIALFLVALPPDVLAPLMVFVGCWQLPMYLTPILLRRLYIPRVKYD